MRLSVEPFLPLLARRLLGGAERDLLRPLELLNPGELPRLPPPGAGTPDRTDLARALRERNAAFGHPRARELAATLARPETLVVTTGQQPGLFGGPLYTLVKAVAAVLWAERLTRATGRPAVAVFWIASDDHDVREIARAFLPAPGEAEPWLRVVPDGRELEPVGPQAVGEQPRALLARRRAAAASERYRAGLDRLAEIYAPSATFTEAFAGVLVELLGEHCPLLLDSADAAVRRLQVPVLRRVLEREEELETALAAREREIEARGLPLRVQPQPGCPPLFVLEEGRRLRLRRCADGEGYELRGGALRADRSAFARLLAEAPERFSPSVLSRPLVQDALLRSAVFLVGPGELSYLAQASALYPVAGVEPGALALRPQALLLDPRRLDQLEALAARGLGVAALLGDDEAFEGALAGLHGGADPLEAPAAAVSSALQELGVAAVALDVQLQSPFDKTREQVERALAALRAKARGSLARTDEETRRRALALRELLRPEGALQERVLCAAHAAGLYGRELAASLRSQLDLDPRYLQILAVGAESEHPLASASPARAAGAP